LMQGDLPLRLINVIAKTVGNVGELVVRQANRASVGNGKFRIVDGNDRFAPSRFQEFSAVANAAGYYRIRKRKLCPASFSGSGGLFRMSDTRDDSLALVESETKEESSWNSG
jgi:hypothetical protein